MENVMGSDDSRSNNQSSKGSPNVVGNLKDVYKKAEKLIKAARWLFSFVPGGAITIGAILVAALIALAFFSIVFGLMSPITGSTPDYSKTATTIPGLTLKLTGPVSINNGEDLQYTVEVTYSGSSPPLSDIIVYDTIPANTTFVSASGAYTYGGNEIAWPMSQNDNIFTFALHPTTPDTEIANTVYARLATGASAGSGSGPSSGSGSGSSGTGAAATINSCGGKYDLAATPVGANFGDPDCKFTKDDLYSFLKLLDPTNADIWYFKIVPCESGFNPNAYNGAAVDAGGAFGLFQMGRGKNGALDHGDVDWGAQASNATGYNKGLGESFAYWGCY